MRPRAPCDPCAPRAPCTSVRKACLFADAGGRGAAGRLRWQAVSNGDRYTAAAKDLQCVCVV
eukprot:89300-Chlamydomonas_euryale.AAC.5